MGKKIFDGVSRKHLNDRLRSSESVIRRYGVRDATEVCCATCKYFDNSTDDCGCGECTHPNMQSHGDYSGPLLFPKSHQVCDLWEGRQCGSPKVVRAVLRIPRELLDRYAEWMQDGATPDLNEEQRRLGVAQAWTVEFEDGIKVDVKVCCGREEGECWCELAWTTRDGIEYTHSTPDDNLEGAWYDDDMTAEEHVVHELLILDEEDDVEDW